MRPPNKIGYTLRWLSLLGCLLLAITSLTGVVRLPPLYLPTNAVFVDTNPATANTFSTAASFPGGGGGPMRLASGSYIGDGTDDRAILVFAFEPDAVFIKCECNRPGVVRTNTMLGDAAKTLTSTGTLDTDLIQSLDSSGFVIGSDVNVNKDGEVFHWAALKAGDELVLGTYLGDGNDDRSITGIGFKPEWVATIGDGDDSIFRPGSVVGDASFAFSANQDLTNRIQAMQLTGFQVGSNSDVNSLGITYHYLAWNSSVNVSQASYDGDGNDDRSIGGAGFAPQLVWIKRGDNSPALWRTSSVGGDLSLEFGNSVAGDDLIQAIEIDGFQIGGSDPVNKKNRTYHYLALRDGGP